MATAYTIRAAKTLAKAWQIAKMRHPKIRTMFENGVLKIGPYRLLPGGQATITGSTLVRFADILDLAIDAGLLELVSAVDADGPEVISAPVVEVVTDLPKEEPAPTVEAPVDELVIDDTPEPLPEPSLEEPVLAELEPEPEAELTEKKPRGKKKKDH